MLSQSFLILFFTGFFEIYRKILPKNNDVSTKQTRKHPCPALRRAGAKRINNSVNVYGHRRYNAVVRFCIKQTTALSSDRKNRQITVCFVAKFNRNASSVPPPFQSKPPTTPESSVSAFRKAKAVSYRPALPIQRFLPAKKQCIPRPPYYN